jgi:hypothetical protein
VSSHGKVANEPIAAPVQRLDKPRCPGIIPESLPQLLDADRQRYIVHRRLGPDGIEQGSFGYQLPTMRQQTSQHGKSFGPQGNPLRPPPEAGIGEI